VGNRLISVKTAVAIVIGAVLMFLLMRFIAVPSGVRNTSLNLGIAVLSIFAAIYGPLAGLLIGFIGHTLNDLTLGRISWSWVLAEALYGFVVGFLWKSYRLEEGRFGVKQALLFNTVQVVANMLAWVAVAPYLSTHIYHESAEIEYLQGLAAVVLDIAVVLILGTPFLFIYSGNMAKSLRST